MVSARRHRVLRRMLVLARVPDCRRSRFAGWGDGPRHHRNSFAVSGPYPAGPRRMGSLPVDRCGCARRSRGTARLALDPADEGTSADLGWTVELASRPMRAMAHVGHPLLRWGHDLVVQAAMGALAARLPRRPRRSITDTRNPPTAACSCPGAAYRQCRTRRPGRFRARIHPPDVKKTTISAVAAGRRVVAGLASDTGPSRRPGSAEYGPRTS